MPDLSALEMLGAARALIAMFLSDPLASRRSESAALVEKIDALLARAGANTAPAALVDQLRAHWRSVGAVRFENAAVVQADARGLWVSAWLLAPSSVGPITPRTFEAALTALPLMAREVYTLHRIVGFSVDNIGNRLGLDAAAVEELLFKALRDLYLQIYSRR